MLKSLRIRNYRVFEDMEIDGLHRINLIAGGNNSGKTALLEAIFLLAGGGNPQFAINANVIRGDGASGFSSEIAWKHMFFGLDMSRAIEIEARQTDSEPIKLTIATERSATTLLPLNRAREAAASDVPDGRSLAFTYSDGSIPELLSHIRLTPQGISMEGPETRIPFDARIILARSGNDHEYAALLAKFRTRKADSALLQTLRIMEPRLQSVEDSIAMGAPMIWGDIGLSEMIPLHAMGEGMTRLAKLALGIAATPGGAILVDEIENGLHYSAQVKIWEAIEQAAERFDTQVFATTHSFECIQAAVKALTPEGFRYFRLSKAKGAVSYEPRQVELATRRYMEIR